jgi:hypothetical protein
MPFQRIAKLDIFTGFFLSFTFDFRVFPKEPALPKIPSLLKKSETGGKRRHVREELFCSYQARIWQIS